MNDKLAKQPSELENPSEYPLTALEQEVAGGNYPEELKLLFRDDQLPVVSVYITNDLYHGRPQPSREPHVGGDEDFLEGHRNDTGVSILIPSWRERKDGTTTGYEAVNIAFGKSL